MNILTLSIKQKYFDEILAGKKTHEYREIRPTNAKKYITLIPQHYYKYNFLST